MEIQNCLSNFISCILYYSMIENLCTPALMYIAFSLTQILIDMFKGMYNTAFLKSIVMIIFSFVLNLLCIRGLGIISWIIVFVPFIMMTVITSMLLLMLGISPATGGLEYKVDYPQYPRQTEPLSPY